MPSIRIGWSQSWQSCSLNSPELLQPQRAMGRHSSWQNIKEAFYGLLEKLLSPWYKLWGAPPTLCCHECRCDICSGEAILRLWVKGKRNCQAASPEVFECLKSCQEPPTLGRLTAWEKLMLHATECIPSQYTYLSTKVLKYVHKRERVIGKLSWFNVCFPISLRTPSWSNFSSSTGCWFINPLRQWVLKYGLQAGTNARERCVGVLSDALTASTERKDRHWMFWLASLLQTHQLTAVAEKFQG